MNQKMTYEQAVARSRDLELEALRAIAYRRPEAERRKALAAYVQFNPYVYLFEDLSHAN